MPPLVTLPPPPSTRPRKGLGNGSNEPSSRPSSNRQTPDRRGPSWPLFFGGILALAVIGLVIYFGPTLPHSPLAPSPAKKALADVASWQTGWQNANTLDSSNDLVDISWWARTFDLPSHDRVLSYLQEQGLVISRLEPLHYETSQEGTTLTYLVHAQIPNQLLRLKKVAWQPSDPDMARFASVLVLNKGLPAGTLWDTPYASVVAKAETARDFAWQVRWDKASNRVTTDRFVFSDDLFTQQQVNQYQTEAADTISALAAQIAQINNQVQNDLQAQLAQVSAVPPKPEALSIPPSGDNGDEAAKSPERMSSGAGAATAPDAFHGAIAGKARESTGVGATSSLLGGSVNDVATKGDDRKKHEAVGEENSSRTSAWNSQVAALNQQRDQINQNAPIERENLLADLANRIAAANGLIANIAPPSPNATASPQPAPAATSAVPADAAAMKNSTSSPLSQP